MATRRAGGRTPRSDAAKLSQGRIAGVAHDRLARALAKAVDATGQPQSALAKALRAESLPISADVAQLFADLDAGRLLKQLRALTTALATLARREPAALAAGADDRDLGWQLMLAGVQRYAELSLGAPLQLLLADGKPLEAPDPFRAEVLAALASGSGLRLVLRDGGPAGSLWADNCLADKPHLQLQPGDPSDPAAADKDLAMAWLAEADAWADAAADGAAHYQQLLAKTGPQRAADRVVSVPLLAAKLDDIADSQGIGPYILLPDAQDSQLGSRPGAQQLLQTTVGVPTVRVRVAPPVDKLALLPQVQATVSDLLAAFFRAVQGVSMTDKPATNARRHLFISYAHKDGKATLDALRVHLAGVPDTAPQPWSDKMIATGDAWRQEIDAAMERASCAVLILTPHFLASPFINGTELPKLFAQHHKAGMQIRPLLAKHCVIGHRPDLNWLQIASGDVSLDKLTPAKRNDRLVQFAEELLQWAKETG